MKKELLIGLFGLLVAVLFIVGCIPAAYVCPDGSRVIKPGDCAPVQEEAEEEEPVIVEYEPEIIEEEEAEEEVFVTDISEDVQALFDKIVKVNILKYTYLESPDYTSEHIYYVSNDKMKIKLKNKIKFEEEYYDAVYLDLIEKTGVAYCENTDRGVCPDKDKAHDVDFEEFIVGTPFDWIPRITKAELTGRSQRLEDRNALEMSFEIKGVSGAMFLDSFFGVPIKITFNDKEYRFKDITINLEKMSELEHQFAE